MNPPEFVAVPELSLLSVAAAFAVPSVAAASVEPFAAASPVFASVCAVFSIGACCGAASFSVESPRIWKDSTAALTEASASSVFTPASIV